MPEKTPEQTSADLVAGVFAVIEGDAAYKAKVLRGVIDNLVGNDPNAIVRKISGLPESLVETVTDGLLDAIEGAVVEKLTPPDALIVVPRQQRRQHKTVLRDAGRVVIDLCPRLLDH